MLSEPQKERVIAGWLERKGKELWKIGMFDGNKSKKKMKIKKNWVFGWKKIKENERNKNIKIN